MGLPFYCPVCPVFVFLNYGFRIIFICKQILKNIVSLIEISDSHKCLLKITAMSTADRITRCSGSSIGLYWGLLKTKITFHLRVTNYIQ